MTPASSLKRIQARALSRVRRLDDIFHNRFRASERTSSLIIGGVVIELDNLFIQSIRLLTQCSLRSLVRSGGISIPNCSKNLSELEFSTLVVGTLEPKKLSRITTRRQAPSRRDEPTIRDPSLWAQFFTKLGSSPPRDFGNAISLNIQVYGEIAVFRNFYAHRGQDTLQHVASQFPQLSVGLAKHPDELVTSTSAGVSQAKYPQWSDEVKQFLATAAGV